MMQKWIYRPEPPEEEVDAISSSLGFGSLASKILVIRGIDTYAKAREFFKPRVEDIHDPFLMTDMQKAVDRIVKAIDQGEKILVYGDYDVDGTTSVALVYLYLNHIYEKEKIDYYVPDRNSEGYGISQNGIDFAKENGFSLVIALDCGIKSTDKMEYASGLGLDFIICDHHLPGDTLPKAVAVLDPKRKDCHYPFKELSGCGVGYKLCQALNTIYKLPERVLQDLTDLLVISIASDIVSMTGENRLFAKMGMKKLRKTKRKGLRNLIPRDKLQHFTISNIVFDIAPKINAAGRVSHAKAAVELLITETEKEAHEIVNRIMDLNSQRRTLDSNTTEEALEQVKDSAQENDYSLIVYQPSWNKGVIGIVASRLIETYYKPTIVFTDGKDGEMVASARSVADFDLHSALDQCSDLFLKFGGHHAAAGLSMEKKNFEAFKVRFEEIVKKTIQPHQKTPSIIVDSKITLKDLNAGFFQFHRWLAPFGPGNMKPNFEMDDVEVVGKVRRIGKSGGHLKFNIKQKDSKKEMECLAFKMGDYIEQFSTQRFDMVFTIEENYWKDMLTYYLNIKDVTFHEKA